jgi:hypothetical protein
VYIAFQIMTVMLAAVTMALSLAHALELPGKLRLNKEQYLAVQAIYYSCGCLRASRVASDHGCRPVTPRDVLALSGLFKRTHLEVRFLRKSGHACEHVECPKMTQSGHSRVARCALMSVHLNC